MILHNFLCILNMVMNNIDEFKIKLIIDNIMPEILTLVKSTYSEGYNNGYEYSRQVLVGGVVFYDLGLPSGTLWSNPITLKHPYTYITYDLRNYDSVRDLSLPSIEDFQELLDNCSVMSVSNIVSKDIEIIGPSGARLRIGTKDYLHNSYNPNSILCRRQGERVKPMTNQFWLKSDCVDNMPKTGFVDFEKELISTSSAFVGLKLPYLLVKKIG